jgi:DNA repair exonuclease SbcCD nuclease subunit
MKIVHAADLHLDSPLRGLERYEGAPVDAIRGATRRALENLVELCVDEGASLLLLAGDLYDGDWKDYSTGLFFAAQMSKLREAGVQVVWIRGNHDAASQITKHLRLPDNVRELALKRPETVVYDELGVAIHGQGFATREVTRDLAAHYPEPKEGLLNIGMLHTAVTGRAGHASYAPCTVETLVNRGYDYWALGHVHQREVLHTDPWVVFPGNLQGRHARETGAKGATLVHVSEGRVQEIEHCPLDVVRWTVCEIDASGASTAEEVVDLARDTLEREAEEAEGRMLAARVRVVGESPAHSPLQQDPERWAGSIRASANDIATGPVWVEKVRLRTREPIDRGALAEHEDVVGQLVRSLDELRQDEEALTELLGEFDDLKRKLPRELREGEEGIRLDDPETLRGALDDVEQLLLPRLVERERSR